MIGAGASSIIMGGAWYDKDVHAQARCKDAWT